MKANQVYAILKSNTRQELDALYASTSETITSDNGDEIEIENCINPSRLLEYEIKGQTIQNYFDFEFWKSQMGEVFMGIEVVNNKECIVGRQIVEANLCEATFKENTQYTIGYKCMHYPDTTPGIPIMVSIDYTDGTSDNYKASLLENNGLTDFVTLSFTTAPNKTVQKIYQTYGCAGKYAIIKDSIQIIEFTSYMDNSLISGFNSTKAIINVNNIGYSICDKDGEIIELHKVGDVCDVLTQNTNGDSILTRKVVVFTPSDAIWTVATFSDTDDYAYCYTATYDNLFEIENRTTAICNLSSNIESLVGITENINSNMFAISVNASNFRFAIKKTELTELTSDGVNQYMSDNNVVVYFEITPTTIYIPKIQIPISSSTNTISIGGDGINASGFSVVMPVDKINKLEQDIISLQNAISLLQS